MNARDKLILVLVIGLLLRLLVMPHTQHVATGVKVDLMDEMLILGQNPLLRGSGFGVALYFFYTPAYIAFNVLLQSGVPYNFLLYTLMKLPPLIGNLIIFYSLYEIVRISTDSKEKALNISVFYFLNPYVLFIESWVGHAEQLSVSLVLLSILFLIKGQSGKSGMFYVMAIFTRYIPVLLFPVYIAYLWLNRGAKGSLRRFIAGFVLVGILLSSPYVYIVYKTYKYSPHIFISYFSHFFDASTVASAYILDREDFMFNFTGFITSLGLWDRFSFFLGARIFLITYFLILFMVIWFIWRKRREITMREVTVFPLIPYALFLILIPLQQHHYLAWILPFLYLASSFSIIPGYFVTILWVGNLLIDPITGQDYKYAFGNTFGDPFPNKTRNFVNWPLQQSISALMGMALVISLYLYIRSVKNRNFYIINSISKFNKMKTAFFVALLVIYSITEIVRMVYHPVLYTYGYSILFSLFILLEFFGLGGGNGSNIVGYEKRDLMHLLNISSMLLIAAVVSIYLWDPSYSSIFIVLSAVGLWRWRSDPEPGDKHAVFIVAGIFSFIATAYILRLVTNHLTLALYVVFLATWIACQIGSEVIARESGSSEKLYSSSKQQQRMP